MTQTLFHVVVLHHKESKTTAAPLVGALRRAFEISPAATGGESSMAPADPWSLVGFLACNDPAEFEKRAGEIGRRALFVVLVSERMVDDPAWVAPLHFLASALPKGKDTGTRDALLFTTSAEAAERLPDTLKYRQVSEITALGKEKSMRPYTLALQALHRARLLLGVAPGKNQLKLFISHAKTDGLFLADALRSLIAQVPGLADWYDAKDIESGVEWSEEIEAAAANSVFIAIRTEAYDQRPVCRDEFEVALAHGVPIVAVDALLQPNVAASPLPFAAVPNVRIPDGNTHRVLIAALREHLRLLLTETLVADQTPPEMPSASWRIWPRLPTLSVIQQRAALLKDREFWLLPRASDSPAEFTAARKWLDETKSLLRLEAVDSFILTAGTSNSGAAPVSSPTGTP